MISSNIKRVEQSFGSLLNLAQGGTAVGSGLNTKRNFDKLVVNEISKIAKIKFKPAINKFQALAAHDAIVEMSRHLNYRIMCS